MFSLILVFLSFSCISCLGTLFNKKYEESLPINVIGIMIFLYIFYILDLLNIGFIILSIITILIYLYYLYRIIRMDRVKRKDVLRNLFTPGLLIYSLCFILIYLITRNNEVLLWDELRLWGAYPKILFYDGSLQLDGDAQLINTMRSYNPGMPLFLFYVTRVFGAFNENLLFFGYAIFGLSLLAPVLRNVKWKEWYYIPFWVVGIILFPLLFANSNNDLLIYYFTLFIEPALGIIFGYSMYLTFNSVLNDKFKYLLFIMVVSGAVLLKDTGILFSVIACVSFLINEFVVHKNYKKEKYGLFKLVIPVLIALVLFGSWKLVQGFYESENIYTSVLSSEEIVSLFTNPTSKQKDLLDAAKKEVLFTPIVKSNFPSLDRFYSFPIMFFILLGFLISFAFIRNKTDLKNSLISVGCFGIGSIVFLLGTLFVYFFSIHTVASFPRYISLLFTAGSVIIGMLVCDEYSLVSSKKKKYLNYYLCVIIFFCLVAMPIKQPTTSVFNFLIDTNDVVEGYSDTIKEYTKPKDKIALVFNDDHKEIFGDVIFHHQIYMDLIDEGYYAFDKLYVSDESFDYDDYKDYDYLYFISINDKDLVDYSSNLDIEIKKSSLFEVSKLKKLYLVN